jgi:hypothetical protein
MSAIHYCSIWYLEAGEGNNREGRAITNGMSGGHISEPIEDSARATKARACWPADEVLPVLPASQDSDRSRRPQTAASGKNLLAMTRQRI